MSRKDTIYIGVYVDDMILAGKDENKLKIIKEELSARFDIKDLGKQRYFYCSEAERDLDGTTCVHRKAPDEVWDE